MCACVWSDSTPLENSRLPFIHCLLYEAVKTTTWFGSSVFIFSFPWIAVFIFLFFNFLRLFFFLSYLIIKTLSNGNLLIYPSVQFWVYSPQNKVLLYSFAALIILEMVLFREQISISVYSVVLIMMFESVFMFVSLIIAN